MKERICGLVAALLLSSGRALTASPTTDVVGNWTGTLDTQPVKLRLVLRINKLAGGPFAATLDSLDQNIRDIPVSTITVTSNKLRLEARAIHVTYEATLDPAGTKFTGQWRQGGAPLSLTLERQPATAAAPATEAVPLDFQKQSAVLPDDQYVRSILQRWIEQEKRAVGLAVGILDANGTRVITCGRSGNPARPQVDGDTLFEIGSITKVFTATLLADMVKRGEVTLDDTVRQCLPSTFRFHSPGAGDIKLRQLATHTSGLPRLPEDPAFFWSMIRDSGNPYRHYSEAQLFTWLEQCQVNPAAAHEPEYSNLGGGLLGQALAHKARLDYGTLLTQRVLLPLGMTNTWIKVPPQLLSLFAVGHNARLRPVPHWDLPALAGAGALRSSVNDMLKFLAANLNHTPPIDPMLHEVMASGGGMTVGLNWMLAWGEDRNYIHHNGGTGGFASFIVFKPKDKTGVVILSNVSEGVEGIAMHLLAPQQFALTPPPALGIDWTWILIAVCFGVVLWTLVQPIAAPAAESRRRWFQGKPVRCKLEMAESLLAVAFIASVLWSVCAGLPWGMAVRAAFLLLALSLAVRYVVRGRQLPWFDRWSWLKWLGHALMILVLLLALLISFLLLFTLPASSF